MKASISRRQAIGLLAASAMTGAIAQSNAKWPSRPIKFVVAFPPGGANDVIARILGTQLQQRLGQPVVVENKAGAGGTIGTASVAQAPADGYTILLTPANFAITATLYKKLPYDAQRDFRGVAFIASAPNVLVVNSNVQANTTAELIQLAKKNPGGLTYGSSGNGGTFHLAGELFKRATGVDIVHVPYRGTAPAMQDLLGGQVSLMFATMQDVLPHIASGKLRALAVTTAKRSSVMPNVPTVNESAGVANLNYDVSAWFAVTVRADTPNDVVDALSEQIQRSLDIPAVKNGVREQGAFVADRHLPPAEVDTFIKKEIARWEDVIKAAGITPE